MFWKKQDDDQAFEAEKKVLYDFNQLLVAVESDEMELIHLERQIDADFAAINKNVQTTCHKVDDLVQ